MVYGVEQIHPAQVRDVFWLRAVDTQSTYFGEFHTVGGVKVFDCQYSTNFKGAKSE